MGVKFGKGKVWCGSLRKPTANLRELTRIAFFLRSGALLRLIACAGIAPSLEKCWGKTRPRVFLILALYLSFFIWVRGSDCGLPAGRPQLRRVGDEVDDLSRARPCLASKSLICDPARSGPRWGVLFMHSILI